MPFDVPFHDDVVAAALAEDLGVPAARLLGGIADPALLERDVTSLAAVDRAALFEGVITARDGGVVCGLPVVDSVFAMLSRAAALVEPVEVFPLVAEGMFVAPGSPVAEISGSARAVMTGERTALDLLMVLSGMATEARRWQDAAGDELAVLDTRKTLPGLRALSKYAVRVGGAHNHRLGLWDMVLVKDNHIAAAGSISSAIGSARQLAPGLSVEVEADTIEQASEAARSGADIVLLDNMDDAQLAEAVVAVREAAESVGARVLTEASGGVRIERLGALRAAGVDRVSTSALTLARPLDFGLDGR